METIDHYFESLFSIDGLHNKNKSIERFILKSYNGYGKIGGVILTYIDVWVRGRRRR